MTVSIAICTQNRADSLKLTLDSMESLIVPPDWQVELIVVDNGSTDHTRDVVTNARLTNIQLRYAFEPNRGVDFARNRALQESLGEVILYTDDDVRPSTSWITDMAGPLLRGECDAVGGPIVLGAELERTWLTPLHRGYLAAPGEVPGKNRENYPNLVGANMGFSRRVLKDVPCFDPELDAGALGYYGDTLFSWQLQEAGKIIAFVPSARVIHHPNPDRLVRRKFVDSAYRMGRSKAYLMHHWQHVHISFPRLRAAWLSVKLHLRRLISRPPAYAAEGCPLWELSYVWHISNYRHFVKERRRSRQYTHRGLVKLNKDYPQ